MKNPVQLILHCLRGGEPTFTVRARDRCSLAALQTYLAEVEKTGATPDFIAEIKLIITHFETWRQENRAAVKTPD